MSLRISLFGSGVQIERDGDPDQSQLSSTAKMLLAYLVLYRDRAHSRDVLSNLFWGDYPQERARNCLNTALWRLRRILEPDGIQAGTYLLSAPSGGLAFNLKSQFWLDVAEFESRVGSVTMKPVAGVSEQNIQLLEETMKLYKGDLLEGNYCEWALRERERLRMSYLDAMFYIMKYFCLKNDVTKALFYGQKIISFDPLREDVHRQLMYLFLQNGRRSMAVRQYRQCQDILQKELGVQPMRETQMLYEQLISGEEIEISGNTSQREAEILAAENRLQLAMETLEQVQKDLRKILGFLENQ